MEAKGEQREWKGKKRREGSTRLHRVFFAFIQTSVVFSDFFCRNTALKNKNALLTFDIP